ncbi:7TM diverse intracellular signaling domain-containing protein [Sediminitomix flava]|uniref:Serine phosphatase RsbU (Regulator of sigma subunit) n=1 Tax=Sediminitomix flava TaxID=379075 RepID=A0A315ZAB6_SEDFL|nr:7TM diverse intracellular signaling domain-containing protein [Sediminitomix flava]PWJ42280.1 serine phosphatase RsbU (regulator of sigma subunit) [Sediminitomix flava]
MYQESILYPYLRALIVTFSFSLFSASTAVSSSVKESDLIKENVLFYVDEGNVHDFQSINSLFDEFKFLSDHSFPEIGENQIWMKFDLRSNEKDNSYFIEFPDWAEVELYDLSDNVKIGNTGVMTLLEERTVVSGNKNLIPIALFKGVSENYLVRLKASHEYMVTPTDLSFKTYPQAKFNEENLLRRNISYFFLGVFLIMFFYNFFVFISTNDRSYVYYLMIVGILSITSVFNDGYLLEMLPLNSELVRDFGQIDVILSSMLGISILLFVRRFHQLTTFDPLFNRITLIIIASLVLVTLPDLFGQVALSANLSSLLGLLTFLFVLIISIRSYLRKYPSSEYFLLAYIFFIAGFMTYLFKSIGLIPSSLWTDFSMLIGSSIETVLFSFALSNRINILKKENEEKQEEIIQHLQVNSDLQTKVNRELEGKVMERTKEIKDQNTKLHKQQKELITLNEEIRQQNEEISAQRDMVQEKSKLLENAMLDIQRKNNDILSSINYAKKIQNAIFPRKEELDRHLNEHFILFKPRDIVSGDFYWFKEHNEKLALAVVDCTGHGVPGAFMSMIGDVLLNNIILQTQNPERILYALDHGIRNVLGQDKGGDRNDGMDLSICVIDRAEQTLTYCGANSPLFMVKQDGEEHLFTPNKCAIGGHNKKEKIFQSRVIPLEQGTNYYMYSDGFQDQFGGPDNRKYMSKRFRKTLLDGSAFTMETQRQLLNESFENWKGKGKQIDDVLVFGFRV